MELTFFNKSDKDKLTKARQVGDVFSYYSSGRAEWVIKAKKNDDMYHNIHYDQDNLDNLEALNVNPYTVPTSRGNIRQMMSLLLSNRIKWAVRPVGRTDDKKSNLWLKLTDAFWYLNNMDELLEMAIKDMLNVGHGFLLVDRADPLSENFLSAIARYVHWSDVYIDPKSRNRDYSDAEGMMISRVYSKYYALELLKPYGIDEEKLTNAGPLFDQGETYPEPKATFPSMQTVRINEFYERLIATAYYCEVKKTIPDEIVQEVKIPSVSLEDPKEDKNLKNLINDGYISYIKEKRPLVKKTCTYGQQGFAYSAILPVKNYPLISFVDESRGNPYPLGEMEYLRGMQLIMDEYYLLILINAKIQNGMKILTPEGSLKNVEKWKENFAKPFSINEYSADPALPMGGKPEVVEVPPLPVSFLALVSDLTYKQEYVTGMFGVNQGNPNSTADTLGTNQMLSEYGSTRIKMLARHVAKQLGIMMTVSRDYIRAYTLPNSIIRYVKDEKTETVEINKYETQAEGEIISTVTDVSVGEYDIMPSTQPNFGSTRQMYAQMLTQAAAQMQGYMEVFIPYILDYLDSPDAKEIGDKIDIVKNLKEQLAQASQINEALQKELKNLSISNEQIGRELKLNDFEVMLDKSLNRFKAGLDSHSKVAKATLDLETQNAVTKLQETANADRSGERSAQ